MTYVSDQNARFIAKVIEFLSFPSLTVIDDFTIIINVLDMIALSYLNLADNKNFSYCQISNQVKHDFKLI